MSGGVAAIGGGVGIIENYTEAVGNFKYPKCTVFGLAKREIDA